MYSTNLIIFIISSISSFEAINVLMLDSKTFFWIAGFVAKTATVNPNSIKTPLANTLSVKNKPVKSD